MSQDDPSSKSASCHYELLSSTSFGRLTLASLIRLLLVKPLIGLEPVELDLELSSEPSISLRKTGLIIGRQAFWEISIKTNSTV